MKKIFVFFYSLFLLFGTTSAQNIGIGTTTPNASAQLDVSSTNRGLLPPRMSFNQRNSIQSPAAGLVIYCTNCGTGELQFYNGSNWINTATGTANSPFILPTILTSSVSSVNQTSAISGGNILNSGGASITARGVVWSTSPAPTVDLPTKTTDGTGTGTYRSNITGLSASTTYYVRAYATNSVGTAYGTEFEFTTTADPLPPATITDQDGNSYTVLTICDQTWTTKNLDVSTYSDGTPIPEVTNPVAFNTMLTGAWCYYENKTENGTVYGKLYNWYAVAGIYDAASRNNPALRKKLAPQGWHVPSDAEWATLATCLGGESVAGGKLKSAGLDNWLTPNQDATNSSGFSALPGGFLLFRSTSIPAFDGIGLFGSWWTSSESFTDIAFFRSLDYSSGTLARFSRGKTLGLSVRLVKD